MRNEIRIGIIGASGYTGSELARIFERHPSGRVIFTTAESQAGVSLRDLYPTAPDHPLVPTSEAPLSQADVVFLGLPHGAAARTAVECLQLGIKVIDLSADFRIRDPATYEAWYDVAHPAPALLSEAVYGLTEYARAELPDARLVANPGCYPTSVLLALAPLLQSDVGLGGPIISDSKSGVSGAGRKPSPTTHFVQVSDNLSPYKVGRAHRHLPEMEQGLQTFRSAAPSLVFTPHLLPVARGMLSTIYVPLSDAPDPAGLQALYEDRYAEEPFVRVLPPGQPATLAHSVHTNSCVVSLAFAGETLVITSTIDNLVKGAAGQAVQNMNVMLGLDETAGLIR